MKLADTPDLGSGAVRRGGSSPSQGTKTKKGPIGPFFVLAVCLFFRLARMGLLLVRLQLIIPYGVLKLEGF